jgi:hypothetical protein
MERWPKKPALFLVRRACSAASGWKSRPNLMEVKGSEAQGRHGEVGSEGSVEQRYGPMDKNWIGGLRPDERASDREAHIHQGRWW